MSSRSKAIINTVGLLIAIAGIVFLGQRIAQNFKDIDISGFSRRDIVLIVLFSCCSGMLNCLLAFGWRQVLRHLGLNPAALWTIWIYGISQIGRYVPGNIFQIVGRQALGVADGMPAWPLAKSAIWELSLLAGAGVLFSILVLPSLIGIPQPTSIDALIAGLFIVIVVLVGGGIRIVVSPAISKAFLLYFTFLLASGFIFIAIAQLVAPSNDKILMHLPFVCGAYVVAWLVGLVTPGAPAGVGVREVALYMLLSPLVSNGDLLLITIVSRLVSVIGDLVFFAVAAGIRLRLRDRLRVITDDNAKEHQTLLKRL